ncbi:hypothetical protein BaRGS_00009996 [Batillaria attramentaria]|uniref:Pseudouridine synthase RsuA/RluA-like domain-containing protein n=1 Tax=Batillaria attramentaria TaxID=370345 RepID=A0ABD0LHF0_9CAEN
MESFVNTDAVTGLPDTTGNKAGDTTEQPAVTSPDISQMSKRAQKKCFQDGAGVCQEHKLVVLAACRLDDRSCCLECLHFCTVVAAVLSGWDGHRLGLTIWVADKHSGSSIGHGLCGRSVSVHLDPCLSRVLLVYQCFGFNSDIFSETEYYFENGLRKVYPYHYTFSTYAKERWYGRTLQDIFENEFRMDSPDNFRASVKKGNLQINGKVAALDYILKNGDLIEHKIHRHENPVTGTPIEIIEDTPDLVVINKPASIPCHPCGKYRFNTIVFIMGKEFGYANLRNIYRLDRLTSGVLIMGKTARKTKELENQVLHRNVYKEYVARVVGEFPEEEVEVNQPLSPLSHKLTLWHVDKGGKPSRTSFQRLSFNGTTSVVKCIPHTGRTHQIRVHLQFLGHPIVNDPYYNSPAWGPLRGKGGHCDTSFEELCNKIMAEHNVGMWCDGENPLFHQRLALVAADSSTTQLTNPAAENSPNPAVSDRKAAATSAEATGTQDGSPQHKRQRLSPEEKNWSDTALSSDSAQPRSNGKETKREHQWCEFDPAKWVPDASCESCRLHYIDPQPQDLVLYLHALRYKGPTWDFSSKLPDWADADWNDSTGDQSCCS